MEVSDKIKTPKYQMGFKVKNWKDGLRLWIWSIVRQPNKLIISGGIKDWGDQDAWMKLFDIQNKQRCFLLQQENTNTARLEDVAIQVAKRNGITQLLTAYYQGGMLVINRILR